MQKKVMIVVNVPTNESDDMSDAIGKAGGGQIGNYSFCSFSIKGLGRSFPNDEANPTIGTPGILEIIEEQRIEVSYNEINAAAIVKIIKQTSTYEEPAIFVYPLLDFD